MKMVLVVVRAALPLGVIAASVFGMRALIASKPQAARKPQAERGLLVETLIARVGSHKIAVHAKGSVVPAREVILQPEIAGRVRWHHPELVPGGRIQKGETLVRIDRRDFELAVDQQLAQVDRAKLELDLEHGRGRVAEREWRLFGQPTPDPAGQALALRQPQLRTAHASVKSAQSGLEKAKLQLKRTTLKAPFNVLVRSEAVEIGQLVTPQSRLATLVGSDVFWVQVSVPVDELGWLQVPGLNAEHGSAVRVVQELGNQRVVRTGRVERLLGELDPVGRMARLLVRVDDPLGTQAHQGNANARGKQAADSPGLPLLLGAYVSVDVDGSQVDDAFELPRTALRQGNQVYLVGTDGRLMIRTVRIIHRRPQSVLVRGELHAGEQVIITPMAVAVPGMKVRKTSGRTPHGQRDSREVSADADRAAPARRAATPTEQPDRSDG